MGTSRSPAQVAAKFAKLAAELRQANKRGVSAGALLVKSATTATMLSATHGSGRLSGVGRNGAKLSVHYDVKGTAESPAALVRAVGPWQLIEGDTKAHMILPKGVGRAQGRTKAARHAAKQGLYDALFGATGFAGVKPLSTPYGPRYRVFQPGTRGKEPWKRGVAKVEHKILPTIQTETHAAMVRAFR